MKGQINNVRLGTAGQSPLAWEGGSLDLHCDRERLQNQGLFSTEVNLNPYLMLKFKEVFDNIKQHSKSAGITA